MGTPTALQLSDDLEDLAALRENRIWVNHFLPELKRMREEHRVAMRDTKLPAAVRCEHQTAWENAESLLEFLDKKEAALKKQLQAADNASGFLERRLT